MRWLRGATVLALVAAMGCGATGQFALSAEDNNPADLARAFAVEKKPAAGKPLNETGKPLLFIVAAGKPRKLIAWDLAAGKQLWKVDADVSSRVAVGRGLLAALEGNQVVARSVVDGRQLWAAGIGAGKFLGLAADGDRVFYAIHDGSGKRPWAIVGLQGGREIWRERAPGTLGAPAARGGLVYMPFMTQWLAILDAASGKQIARIRQADEALNFVRTTSDGVFYGSRGVFMLDDQSVAGTREGARYAAAKLPTFVRVFYYFDAFKDVQAKYSAFDRNRILWRAVLAGEKLGFQDDRVVVFTYRFFFGFEASSGALKWAMQHPRFDVVAAEALGPSIVFLSQAGELGAIDPSTGGRFPLVRVGESQILGATFDADGFRPAGEPAPEQTADALAAIVADKDARFNAQKLFALDILGTVSGTKVTDALLAFLLDDATPPAIFQKAADVLVERKDPAGVPALLETLKVKYDYIAGQRPRAVAVVAKALGAIGKPEAVPALLAHLDEAETPLDAVTQIATALGACGGKEALPSLRSQVLIYRADPAFVSEIGPIAASIDAVLRLGGQGERELVAFVAEDPRTQPKVADYARRALAQTAKPKEATK